MVKRIQKNGYVCIPKKFRKELPSNDVTVEIKELPGVGKCIVLVPIGRNKKVYYE